MKSSTPGGEYNGYNAFSMERSPMMDSPYEVFNARGPSPLPPPLPPAQPTPSMGTSTPLHAHFEGAAPHRRSYTEYPEHHPYAEVHHHHLYRRRQSHCIGSCCACLSCLFCCCCILFCGAALAAFFLFPRIPDVDENGIHGQHLEFNPLSLVFTESYLVSNDNFVDIKLSHTDYDVYYKDTFIGTSRDNTTWTFGARSSNEPFNITVRISSFPLTVATDVVSSCQQNGQFSLHFEGDVHLQWLAINRDVPSEFDQIFMC